MLCFLPLHLEHLLSVLVFVLLDTNHVDIIFSISIALRKYPRSSGVNPEGTVEVAKGAVEAQVRILELRIRICFACADRS